MDQQDEPSAWVAVLDRLSDEPFYRHYQQRVRELLRVGPGERVLEVGAGTGASAVHLVREHGADVVAMDRSSRMGRAMRSRGLIAVVVADAHELPFATNAFNGISADRTLQHLTDPERAVDEMVRVVAPTGRIVLADPDYDTQVLELPDQRLARRVLRFRADVQLRNGSLAHRQAGLLVDRGLVDVAVEPHTLVVRDPTAVDHVMGLRTWAAAAAEHGMLTQAEVDAFEAQFANTVARGAFLYAVTFFLTSATVG